MIGMFHNKELGKVKNTVYNWCEHYSEMWFAAEDRVTEWDKSQRGCDI